MAHLFLLPEREETNARHLYNFETHTGNITLGFATTTETRDEDFVVLVDKVQATIVLTRQKQSVNMGTTHKEELTGTNAVTFLPFLISCTRTHLRMAELGCFASTPTFSRTMPFACDDPPVGEVLKTLPRARFLYDLSAYLQTE